MGVNDVFAQIGCDFRGGNDHSEYNYSYLVIATCNFVVVQFFRCSNWLLAPVECSG